MSVQPPNRRFKRKLTPFLCQEMLYDYVMGTLDPERRQAVEEFLPTDAETQKRLASLKIGFVYSEKLSQFALKPAILRRLDEAESVMQMGQRHLKAANVGGSVRSRLKISPQILRGGAVAAAVVLLIAAASIVPWRSLTHRKGNAVELAALPATKSPVGEFGPINISDNSAGETEVAEPDGSGDEEGPATADAAAPAGGKVAAQADEESGDEGIPQTLAAAPGPPAINVQVPTMNVATPAPLAAHTEAEEDANAGDHRDGVPKGFVYRAFMSLDNVEDVADDITKKIEDLGGEKAGEVELGWKKGDGRYYHFAMPEANQEKLLDALRAYGPVRISKDSHPRVMPKGRVRIILWVDTPK